MRIEIMESFRPMGQHFSQSEKKSVTPEHALCAARKIVTFIQGADTLSEKVREDLSSEERRSVVEKTSSMVFFHK